MCDKCGTIFSENDEGWSSTNGAIQRRKDDGRRYSEQMNIDLCAACTGNAGQAVPRLPTQTAISAGPSPSSSPSGASAAQAEQDLDHFRLAELERQLNELRYPTPGTAYQGQQTVIIPASTRPDGQEAGHDQG